MKSFIYSLWIVDESSVKNWKYKYDIFMLVSVLKPGYVKRNGVSAYCMLK